MLTAIAIFIGLVLFLLALDLFIINRKDHEPTMKEAMGWSAFWIGLALAFSIPLEMAYARDWFELGGGRIDPVDGAELTGGMAVGKYLAAYVMEKALSVDNLFVIATVFAMFKVPKEYRHRVLFWGIIGAIVMRGLMIGAGTELVARFHWLMYVFGAFLIFTGIRMLRTSEDGNNAPGADFIQRVIRRFVAVSDKIENRNFFFRKDGALVATPLFVALITVECADLVFAVDSIPACLAITGDPFLVFTSNIFAILGLRSLYFALDGMMDRFHHLKTALSLVLVVVGAKMLFGEWLKPLLGKELFIWGSLGLVGLMIAGGIVASVLSKPPEKKP
ncbi:MAG: hypothetical protein RL095_84 [Verrucomicrobiota bacterium]|jgi:tellurite resistance protein TerC